MNKKCLYCGKEFINAKYHSKQKFCSVKCQQESWVKNNKEHSKKWHREYWRKNKKRRQYFQKRWYLKNLLQIQWRSYPKICAKKRNLKWDLDFKTFKKLFQGNCYYCGKKKAEGIDRVDNLKGYSLENCVPCCYKCNHMKWNLSIEDFINHCQKIVNHCKTKTRQAGI